MAYFSTTFNEELGASDSSMPTATSLAGGSNDPTDEAQSSEYRTGSVVQPSGSVVDDGHVMVFPTVVPTPCVDSPTPCVDTPTPCVDTPTPCVDTPTPCVDTPTPCVDTPILCAYKTTTFLPEFKQSLCVSSEHAFNLLNNLSSLKAEQEFCDIVINVQGHRFSAHRVVMCAASDYFSSMFRGAKFVEGTACEVELRGIEWRVFHILLSFIYSGTLELDPNAVVGVLRAADMFGMMQVVDLCSSYLRHRTNQTNVVDLLILAEQHNCGSLYKHCMRYLQEHYRECMLEVPRLSLDSMKQLLVSEDLKIDSELQVLQTVIAWYTANKPGCSDSSVSETVPENISLDKGGNPDNHNIPSGHQVASGYDLSSHTLPNTKLSSGLNLPSGQDLQSELHLLRGCILQSSHNLPTDSDPDLIALLDLVRFPLISRAQLTCCLATMVADSRLREIVQTASVQDKPLTSYPLTPPRHIPRKNARKYILIIGGYSWSRDRATHWACSSSTVTYDSVYKFDSFSASWESLPPLKQARNGHGAAHLHDYVYVAGGESDCMIFDSVERYDLTEKTWSYVAPLTTPRTSFGMVSLGDSLYVFGGWVGSELGSTIERYDPVLDHWHIVGTMLLPKYAFAAVTYQNSIVLLGGLDDYGHELYAVGRYNPQGHLWQNMAPMCQPRAHLAAAVCQGALFAIGGSNVAQGALNTVERFDPLKESWTVVCPMKVARAAPCVAVLDGRLYVFGGKLLSSHSSSMLTTDSVEVYIPERDEWIMLERAPVGCCEAAALTL